MPNAIDILKADETLLASFLLRHATTSGSDAFTDERAAKYLLWFALEGFKEYQQIRFSPDFIAFLSEPVPPFSTRLAAYALIRRPDVRARLGSDPDRFHAWYYLEGVAELGIGALITPREQRFLAEMHPRFGGAAAPLSRAEYFAFLNDADARKNHDADAGKNHDADARKNHDADARKNHDADARKDHGADAGQPYDLDNAAGRERYILARASARAAPLLPWLEAPPPIDHARLPGANIVGFADGVLGIGEDARALSRVLGHAGIMRSIYSIALPDATATSDRYATAAICTDRPIYPVNIFALTAFETARLKIERGANLFAGRYNIGYWPWELTSLPDDWRWVFDLVDEIWASSDFLVETWSRLTDKPVHLVPFYLNVPNVERVPLAQFGLAEDEIVFLTMFDFNSYVARKNPEAAIKAFQRAFPDNTGPERMIVKTLNAHGHPQAFKALEDLLGDDDRFVLIDGAFTRAEVCGLISAVDCFVSLHRSEGFGRVIAEAMLLRTTVIATNWSGNVSFLDAACGYPVDYALRPVERGEYVFHEGSEWAEPSLEDAARKFRLARDNMRSDGPLRQAARDAVHQRYGLDIAGRAVAQRLKAIAVAASHKERG